jgi:HEAT repeat protein
MPGGKLASLVRRWQELLLESDDRPAGGAASGSRTVLRPAASEAEIAALETRLGAALPDSFRTFLACTDGAWAQPGWGLTTPHELTDDLAEERHLGLLDTTRIGWFRNREPAYVEIWGYSDHGGDDAGDPSHYAFRRSIPECEYLDHERDQDSVHAKAGHVRYALQISADIDGYTILLNPLVVDQHGEWEAWDFGSKLPGAMRHRSFRALLEADVARLERAASAPPMFDVEALVPVALDEQRPLEERVDAAVKAQWGGETERVLPILALALADRSLDVGVRQRAAQALARIDEPRACASLVAAAGDPEPRIQSAVLPPLASRDEPEARRAALSILTSPEVDDFVIRSVWAGGAETIWQAWQVRDDPRLLVQLAYCGDRRVAEPLAAALVDPDVPAEVRDWLVRYSASPGDPAVVPALIAATELPDTPLVAAAEALLRLGAEDDAVALLARAFREDDLYGQAAAHLGRIGRPEARQALLDAMSREPTAHAVSALGSYPDAEVAAVLRVAADTTELRVAAIDALERMYHPSGSGALATLVADGDLLAARALARQHDPRALEPLLAALDDDDPAIAFEGADGLRDLRAPEAAGALLDAVRSRAEDDVVACAVHALVSMEAPDAGKAVSLLSDGPSPCLRRLAELWAASPQ